MSRLAGLANLLPMVEKLEILHPEFGARLAAELERAKATIPDIARACGVSAEAARRWTIGAAMPRPNHMRKLAALLGISPADLQYGRVNERNAAPGLMGPQLTPLRPDELLLIEQYRALPDYAQRALRARAVELVEAFGKSSTSNPFGQGGTQ